MEDSGLNRYLDEIGRGSLLSAEEEARLSQQVREGSQQALSRLVEANLRFVVKVAGEYRGQGVDFEDLISEGNVGLMQAAAKFDASRGTRFVNFAVVYVRRAIEKALPQPLSVGKKAATSNIISAFPNREGRGGSLSGVLSVDAPLGHRTDMNLLSVLVNGNAPLADERVYSEAIERAVASALETLDERESHVVHAFYGLGQEHETLAEIAEDMGLKRERVRQIRNRAIRRLKKAYRRQLAEL